VPPASPPPNRCPGCLLVRERCFCDQIPRLETRLRFVVVRHHRELLKASNTGRLAAAALPSLVLMDYGGPEQTLDEALLAPPAWLLFPPERDHEGRETGRHRVLRGVPPEPPPTLVVLDGTWGQARRMSHRIAALDRLPRYLLEPQGGPEIRLRQPPVPGAVSTIEAIARMIERFDSPEVAARLDALYAGFTRRLRPGHAWGRPGARRQP